MIFWISRDEGRNGAYAVWHKKPEKTWDGYYIGDGAVLLEGNVGAFAKITDIELERGECRKYSGAFTVSDVK